MLVMKYGLLAPVEGAEHVLHVLEQAHGLRNKLVEVEIARRKSIRAAYRLHPECADLERAAIDASKAARGALVELRKSKSKTGHLRDQIREARKNGDEPRAKALQVRLDAEDSDDKDSMKLALDKMRKGEHEAIDAWSKGRRSSAQVDRVKAAIAAANDKAIADSKSAARASDLHWGSREVVEASCKQAFAKRPLWDYTWPNDPEVMEFDGRGRIALRFTKAKKPVPVPALYGDSSARSDVIIDRPPPLPSDAKRRNGNPIKVGRKDLRVLRMRIGEKDGKPLWAAWPMILHRMPQSDGVVVGASVCVCRDGDKTRWYATITVDSGLPQPSEAPGEVAVVDIGWRAEDDGALHVATAWAPDGVVDRLLLDNAGGRRSPTSGKLRDCGLANRLRYPDSIRRDNDDLFNRQVRCLTEWVMSAESGAPDWLTEAVKDSHAWRSHQRLIELVELWATKRFPQDKRDVPAMRAWMDEDDLKLYGRPEGPFVSMQAWVKKEHHLWMWEYHQRSAAERQRKDAYRNFAMRLAREYRTVVMTNTDYARVARLRKPNDDKQANETARRNRVLAAPSELRSAIEHVMVKCGGCVEYVPLLKSQKGGAEATTTVASDPDVERCLRNYDVWRDPARKDEIKKVFAEKRESMWTRLRRLKAERVAGEASARKAGDKAAE